MEVEENNLNILLIIVGYKALYRKSQITYGD